MTGNRHPLFIMILALASFSYRSIPVVLRLTDLEHLRQVHPVEGFKIGIVLRQRSGAVDEPKFHTNYSQPY